MQSCASGSSSNERLMSAIAAGSAGRRTGTAARYDDDGRDIVFSPRARGRPRVRQRRPFVRACSRDTRWRKPRERSSALELSASSAATAAAAANTGSQERAQDEISSSVFAGGSRKRRRKGKPCKLILPVSAVKRVTEERKKRQGTRR